MDRSLDIQRLEYSQRRMTAMPLAGMIAWAMVAVAGSLLDTLDAAMALFAATGSIVYLGLALSKLTGENLTDKARPKNAFDALFMHTAAMSLSVYAIAIPFFMAEPTSLPLTVGILTGLMWLPLSWVIRHPVGLWHAGVRTLGVLAAWLASPSTVSWPCPWSSWRCTPSPCWCWNGAGSVCSTVPRPPLRAPRCRLERTRT